PLLDHLLARLCHHSFKRYFDGLPHTVKEKHRSLRERLDAGHEPVLEVIKEAQEPGPYIALARSICTRMPVLPAPVVRALILGWSSCRNEAWCWLRGEQVPEVRLDELELPHES